MGRLLLSLTLDAPPPSVEISTEASQYETWSALNAFDPDSEEFYATQDVVYEAFIDDASSPSASSSDDDGSSLPSGIPPWQQLSTPSRVDIDVAIPASANAATTSSSNPHMPIITSIIADRPIANVLDFSPTPSTPPAPAVLPDLRQLSISPTLTRSRLASTTIQTPVQTPSPGPPSTPHFYTWDRTIGMSLIRTSRVRRTHGRGDSLPTTLHLQG
ncbi:hypothetical protein SISNIDRAFT_484750 [Sistotremastrum niveocremeum HHB9708]|uniref:Uncharacterized protein n=2 Tax=Sistotremastraceae TaxID=3402574 RepID=A0A164VWQ4_9AGAM|nr:hypothetical protein SISNIDRAFT_484750 [Sistotremastrum niveocremeum HHB9708]KZT43203.1 hypothetical protein SISSUDRAFT_1057968 [Sistotremastrum suecicum HHB10207 ss-3]